jgi:hypothetical protein
MLAESYPVTARLRGTVEFDTPAGWQISVLGLRDAPIEGSNSDFAVTTLGKASDSASGTPLSSKKAKCA